MNAERQELAGELLVMPQAKGSQSSKDFRTDWRPGKLALIAGEFETYAASTV
jgi:predicted aconitase with swiveling domain